MRTPPPIGRAVVRGSGFVLGAALLILAFAALDWLRPGLNVGIQGHADVTGIRQAIDTVRAAFSVAGIGGQLDTGIAGIYFDWFGWTLVGVGVITCGLSLVVRGLPGIVVRVFAVALNVAAVGFTFWAVVIVRYGSAVADEAGYRSPSYGTYLSHADAGFWCAVAGFALLAVTALLARPTASPPRRAILGSDGYRKRS